MTVSPVEKEFTTIFPSIGLLKIIFSTGYESVALFEYTPFGLFTGGLGTGVWGNMPQK